MVDEWEEEPINIELVNDISSDDNIKILETLKKEKVPMLREIQTEVP